MFNTNFIYLLGCIPFIQIPYDLYNYRGLSSGTHSVIYSKKNRIETLKIKQEEIKDWDYYNNQNINRIIYYISLCYQIISETDNSKVWGKSFSKFIHQICRSFIKIYKLLNLDKTPEPGTTIFYLLSKSFTLIIITLFLLFISIKLTPKYFTSIIGLIFIITSMHQTMLKKKRLIEISNYNLKQNITC